MLIAHEAWEGALHRLISVIAFTALLFTLIGQAQAEKRVALVIGNGNYSAVSPLANPPNDARLMTGTLRSLGFEVIERIDASQKSMKRAVRDFGKLLKSGGDDAVGLFYYAGHGVQVKGSNYIIPVDAQISSEGDVDIEAIDANAVLSMMEHSGAGLNFVILDACRNNPFLSSNRSGGRGLAEMDAPTGSFIAYATSPGDVAADGDGSNSPYTTALTSAMLEPGVAVEQMFRKVRNVVRSVTNNDQTPWESSSLIGGDFFFNPSRTPTAQSSTGAAFQQTSLTPERQFWDEIKNSNDPAMYEAYLAQFPNGLFVPIAKIKIGNMRQTQVAAINPAQDLNKSTPTRAPIMECDRLAAHSSDEDRVGPGVNWYNLNAGEAIRSCEQALRQYPDERRFIYQLGRANHKDGNFDRALSYYRQAAEQNYLSAYTNLGFMYEEGDGVAKDAAEAVRWYRKAAERGRANAQSRLGIMYQYGSGVTQNDKEAVRWYGKAAEQGLAVAQASLGSMYQYGRGVSQSDVEAVGWYRKAAEQGYPDAQSRLGVMYNSGFGVEKNYLEAVRWFQKAAEQGHANAQTNLGVMYDNGFGIAENDMEAVRWFRKAAEQGDVTGQSYLGMMYDRGDGVAKNDAEAFRWFQKAAEQNDRVSQYNLGVFYEIGRGVAKSDDQAARWYQKSAELGYATAQFNLGIFYENGRGVAKSDDQAARWYQKSAEQGDASAQFNLGVFYETGRGVAKSNGEAVRWYQKSAEQGYAIAQSNLGVMYYNGDGVTKSDSQAKRWLRKAADQGHARALELLKQFGWD